MEKRDKMIYCNCCGKELHMEPMDKREDYLFVQKEWGYFSKKDGEIHTFSLCESCYERWIKQFSIPVNIEMQKELL